MIHLCHKKANARWRTSVSASDACARRIGIRLVASLLMIGVAASAALADGELYGYVSSTGTVHVTNVPTDQRFGEINLKPRYHAAVSDQELEDAVIRYAYEYRLSPALLLAVMKAESSFDPTVISKAGAVGLIS